MTQSLKQSIRSWLAFGLLLLTIFAARSVLADWNPVPTGSMKPTIMEGDVILVNRAAYDLKVPFTTYHLAQWGHPENGEIIVLRSPEDGKRLVKRVIGVPGDRVRLDGDRVWINGQTLPQEPIAINEFDDLSSVDQITHRAALESLGGSHHALLLDVRGPLSHRDAFIIPQDHYFVMGDHRNNSRDSRVFGLVSRDLVLGRAHRVLLSVDIKDGWKPRWHRFLHPLSELGTGSR